jgi:hypothetical protein
LSLASRLFSFIMLAIILSCAGPAAAQGWNADGGEAVKRELQRDPATEGIYSTCPADVFGRVRRRAAKGGLTESACAADPMRCWESCSGNRNGEACFRLARVFQDHAPKGDPRSQILFTMACARGMAAGCTNRGAGVRNAAYLNDLLREQPKARQEACTARSFDVACRNGDSWGCFMHGQAAQNGEGIPRDVARARASYRRACALTEGRDVAGCAAANEALPALDRRR